MEMSNKHIYSYTKLAITKQMNGGSTKLYKM